MQALRNEATSILERHGVNSRIVSTYNVTLFGYDEITKIFPRPTTLPPVRRRWPSSMNIIDRYDLVRIAKEMIRHHG